MKKTSLVRWVLATVAIIGATSGCGQSESVRSVQDTAATSEQQDWKLLTATADAALKSGDTIQAERNYKAAMTEAEKLGADNPAQAEAIANLASFYYVQGDGQQADQLYKGSLALREKLLGLEHTDLVKDLVGLARVSNSQKNYAAAVTYYQRAIAILKKAGSPVPAEIESESAKVKQAAG